MAGVAVGKYAASVFFQDAASNDLRRAQDAAVGHRTAKGRAQGDNGSDIRRPLRSYGARDNPAQTVTDEMDFASGLGECLLDCVIQLPPDQEVRTLSVEPYSGKEGFVSNSRQPLVQRRQISVRAEKSG